MLSSFAKLNRCALFGQLTRGTSRVINFAKMSSQPTYETLSVKVPKKYVYHVELNRPDRLNAFNRALWTDLGNCFETLDSDEDCRVIVLSGAGRLFSAGMDLQDVIELAPKLADKDVARKAKIVFNSLSKYQKCFTSLEVCKKPVLVAVHGACVGAGVNLITIADMRYCTKDAFFQVKEVDIGMAADLGALQRLPKIIGSDSLVRELCYTSRKFPANEALASGLVSQVFEDKESMIKGVIDVAELISKKSPVAVQGTKVSLVYSRDHSVEDSLNHIAIWNQCMLQSEDFINGAVAQLDKQSEVEFEKL